MDESRVLDANHHPLGPGYMNKPFRWKNCGADVATWRHGRMLQEFFLDVVQPTLDALDAKVDEWSKSDDPVAPFVLRDVQELRRATTMAFCLSIQSMWERQVRTYLKDSARELSTDRSLAERALVARWEDLDQLLFDLRGIHLSSFREYCQLDLLHLVANACRHGDGPSSEKLWRRFPKFWPDRVGQSRRVRSASLETQKGPSANTMLIAREQLGSFVGAIVSFWEGVEYIYLESIERKHETVEEKLLELRKERTKRSKVQNYAAYAYGKR